MTLHDLLREAKRIAPHLNFQAWDRTDYDARPYEVKIDRETRIEVTGKLGGGSREGITVVMDGPTVKEVKPGTTVTFWQADPVMRAWREVPSTAAEPEPAR